MKRSLAIALSAAMLFAPALHATEIRQFDRMAGDDQITFVDKLVDSVEAACQNDPALLARVKRFFLAKQPGEQISGMGRFSINLSLARIADLQVAEKNPNARRLEVEDVMYATLFKSGIILNKNFRPVAVNFHPQKPLSSKYLTMVDANKELAQQQAWAARNVVEHTFNHGGPVASLSGFTDDQKAIAFFVALTAAAVLLKGSGSGGGPTVAPYPPAGQSMNDIMKQAQQVACAATQDWGPCRP
ncbi:MAG: hypothetical protein WA755_13605 [Candidatus Acidiferrales bacterium]